MAQVSKRVGAAIALAAVTLLVASQPASAITAELAKKCREMAAKAFPIERVKGKPGNAKAQSQHYRECVAKNGKVE